MPVRCSPRGCSLTTRARCSYLRGWDRGRAEPSACRWNWAVRRTEAGGRAGQTQVLALEMECQEGQESQWWCRRTAQWGSPRAGVCCSRTLPLGGGWEATRRHREPGRGPTRAGGRVRAEAGRQGPGAGGGGRRGQELGAGSRVRSCGGVGAGVGLLGLGLGAEEIEIRRATAHVERRQNQESSEPVLQKPGSTGPGSSGTRSPGPGAFGPRSRAQAPGAGQGGRTLKPAVPGKWRGRACFGGSADGRLQGPKLGLGPAVEH